MNMWKVIGPQYIYIYEYLCLYIYILLGHTHIYTQWTTRPATDPPNTKQVALHEVVGLEVNVQPKRNVSEREPLWQVEPFQALEVDVTLEPYTLDQQVWHQTFPTLIPHSKFDDQLRGKIISLTMMATTNGVERSPRSPEVDRYSSFTIIVYFVFVSDSHL